MLERPVLLVQVSDNGVKNGATAPKDGKQRSTTSDDGNQKDKKDEENKNYQSTA